MSHRGGHYAVIVGLASLLFFWNLGGATLWDLDEGRNATAAHEMLATGDWIVPTFNGQLRDHKPVLIYWLQTLAYRLVGVGETGARLPSALAALVAALAVYELARRMFSKTTGLLAAVAFMSTPMTIGAARFANPDALLLAFSTLTLAIVWRLQEQPTAMRYALAGAAAGVAVLAKGPVGVLLPGAVVFGFVVWERRWGLLFDRRTLLAMWMCLLVAAPWYLAVASATRGEFVRGFFGAHNAGRFLNTMENHRGNVLYYPLTLFVGTMPWSIVLVGVAWTAAWSCVRRPSERWSRTWSAVADPTGRGQTAAYRYLCVWLMTYVVFFTLSATKLPNYVLPATAPLAILTARTLERWRRETLVCPGWYAGACVAGLALFGVGWAAGLGVASGWGELSVLRGRFFPELGPYAWLGAIPLGAALVAATRSRTAALVAWAVAAVTLYAPAAAWASAALNARKAPRDVAHAFPAKDADLRVVGLGVEHLPSLSFYVQRPIEHLPDAATLAHRLRLPMPVYALVTEEAWDAFRAAHPNLGRETSRRFDLYRNRATILVVNQL